MANTTIQIKKSGVTGNVPASLNYGELAINYYDGKLFYKNASGVITYISTGGVGGSSNSFSTIVANGSSIIATSATDILTVNPGNNITVTANTTAKSFNVALKDSITLANLSIPTVYTTGGGIVFPDGSTQATAASGAATDQTARNIANSKTYTFYTNSAPATSNAHDLWVNSDTGVVYENFGNTSNPVWAEFGPTGTAINTAPGVFSATQIKVNYTPPTGVNSAIEIVAANTKGGAGYADVLTLTNISGGTTNPNKYLRITQTGALEIINSTYTTRLLELTENADLNITGNVTMSGVKSGYSTGRPGFRVYGANTTNALTTTQNGTGFLNYNNWAIDFNQGSYLDNSTGVFTAPVAGLYQVNLVCRNSGYAGGISQMVVKQNSGIILMIEFAASSTMNHTGGATTVKMAAGDTLKLQVTGGQVTFDGNDNWSVAYLG